MPSGVYNHFNRKTGKFINCKICNKRFWIKRCNFTNKKFCSNKCYYESLKGRKLSEITCQKMSDRISGKNHPMYGKKHTKETIEKISNTKKEQKLIGEKSHSWKGEYAGKKPKHQWVVLRKGKASECKCEHCGKQANDWSNKDHKYSRKLEDYQALCRKCHRKYDKKYNNKK